MNIDLNNSEPRIKSSNAIAFMGLLKQAVSAELVKFANVYIKEHLDYLKNPGFSPKNPYASKIQSDNNQHVVFYALNENEQIIGFRYFYFEPTSTFCCCFATFVDRNYRRNNIAFQLILDAFNDAIAYGCTEFEILLTTPTHREEEEKDSKDALFALYRKFARANEDRYKFKINYSPMIERYGYPETYPYDCIRKSEGKLCDTRYMLGTSLFDQHSD